MRLGRLSVYLICMKGELMLQTDFLLVLDQKAGIDLSVSVES